MKTKNAPFAIRTAVFFAISVFFLASCSESVSSIVSVSATAVFDFENDSDLPSQRLCVFLRVSNEIQRVDKIIVRCEEEKLSWTVEKPAFFSSGDMQFAFCNNLQPPRDKNIPEGRYEITYVDAAGNEDTSYFTIKYNSDIIAPNPDEKVLMKKLGGYVSSFGIYDSDGELLYLGKKKSSWNDVDGILKDYRIADFTRNMYSSADYTVLCILPSEKLIYQ